mgnify:CR=1 FL=1
MKITIINVANKMPNWVDDACNDYIKRINRGKYSCQFIEIKSDKNPNKSATDNKALEAKKILSQIPVGSFIIVLDEKGIKFDSLKFANKLENITLNYSLITFIIGGADGVHENLKAKANLVMQLSDLTFPHALVRIIILEQIYRAITILENHPYHRE